MIDFVSETLYSRHLKQASISDFFYKAGTKNRMTNLSLKEQLQALSTNASLAINEQVKKSTKPQPSREKSLVKQVKHRPAWLEYAQYGVELLKANFPQCFKETKEVQPLKVGIKQDLVKHLGIRNDIVVGDKACMVSSLAYYVSSIFYQRKKLEGAARTDLEGSPVGNVTAEEAKHSMKLRQAKLAPTV